MTIPDNSHEPDRLLDRVHELEAEIAQLKQALTSRQELGLVTGILAVRLGVTPDVVWSFIVRLSKESNTKAPEIAGSDSH